MNEDNPRPGFFGLTRPQTASIFVGMDTLSFEIVKYSRLTAIASPPPVLFLLGVLIYLIPCNSSISSIFCLCFFFVSFSQISEIQQISVALSFISLTKKFIFGNKERALNVDIEGKNQGFAFFTLRIICLTGGNRLELTLLGL